MLANGIILIIIALTGFAFADDFAEREWELWADLTAWSSIAVGVLGIFLVLGGIAHGM